MPAWKNIVIDSETNGLLDKLTRIHCIVIRDLDTGDKARFRLNDVEDTIDGALDIIEAADLIVGQNIIAFDLPAFRKVYPTFETSARLYDTLVMSRMVFANQKDKDFRLAERGRLPGQYIGQHNLKAWGYRLGLNKGDYADNKAAELKALYPDATKEWINDAVWAEWSIEMEDYCDLDVDVNTLLYSKLIDVKWSDRARILEHTVHSLMMQQEVNGFDFDREGAEALADELQGECDKLIESTKEHYGSWAAPGRKRIIAALWDDPEGINEDKKYLEPRPEYGEDRSRKVWAEVEVPSKTLNFKDPMRASRTEGAAYCPIQIKEFNPGSRDHIIDRFTSVYGWHPADFTDTGRPSVDDETLRAIAETGKIPMAEELADLFYYQKRLGMIRGKPGKKGWLKMIAADGKIHHYCNVGGTITGRASHVGPNLGQVPKVHSRKDKTTGEKIILKGKEGKHGWECRSLFKVPQGWSLVGCDQSGIELRCLGNLTHPFDGGALLTEILSGDPHTKNMHAMEIDDRDAAKRFLYACVTYDTQALTRKGWKLRHELKVGDEVLTYNAARNVKEWKPILEIVDYPSAPIIELGHKHTFKFKVTPNHRWFTKRRPATNSKRAPGLYAEVQVRTTDEINTEDCIIVNAPMFDPGTDPFPMDVDVAEKYGVDWCARVGAMTQDQRVAFMHGFLIADGFCTPGTDGRRKTWKWNQLVGPLGDAALMASFITSSGRLHTNIATHNKNPMINVSLSERQWITGQRLTKTKLPDAPVWCVRTENESWVMRQGNAVTITGNTMYGAGDPKLGSIILPLGTEDEQRAIGAVMKERLMGRIPGLKKAVEKIQQQARRRGWIEGLDGRRLYVRSAHSALNTKLQSDAALIAKEWVTLSEEFLLNLGWVHGWDGDFAFCAWVHDELQIAVREGLEEAAKEQLILASHAAGESFNFACRVDAEATHGKTWAETH